MKQPLTASPYRLPYEDASYFPEGYEDFSQLNDENILEEANRITSGDRGKDYGHPLDDYLRTAALWNTLLSHKLKPGEQIDYQDAIRCMCAMKLSRDVNSPKRDNMVDLAGYAHCRYEAEQEEKRRIAAGELIFGDADGTDRTGEGTERD